MDAGPGPGSLATSGLNGGEPLDWQFLQCFGERTPGEEIQEGVSNREQQPSQPQNVTWMCCWRLPFCN